MADERRADALTPPEDLAALGEWIDGLVQGFADHPDAAVRERVFALLDGVDALHRAALGRLAALLQAPGAEAVWAQARQDRLIRTTLLLYDLLPRSEWEQAEEALAAVSPYIESHGGRLELRAVVDGVVTVRLTGSCQDCAGSPVTLRRVVEGALRDGFGGFQGLRVETPSPPTRLLAPAPPVPATGPTRGKRALPVVETSAALPPRPLAPRWHTTIARAELPPGALRGLRVAGEPVVLCNVGGEVFAYRDACPDTPLALSPGHVAGEAIVCPWHGCRFDARTGRRLEHRGTGLAPFPVAIVGHTIRVAVNVPGPTFDDRLPAAPASHP